MGIGDRVTPRGFPVYHSDDGIIESIDPFVSGEPLVWVTQRVAYKQSDVHGRRGSWPGSSPDDGETTVAINNRLVVRDTAPTFGQRGTPSVGAILVRDLKNYQYWRESTTWKEGQTIGVYLEDGSVLVFDTQLAPIPA